MVEGCFYLTRASAHDIVIVGVVITTIHEKYNSMYEHRQRKKMSKFRRVKRKVKSTSADIMAQRYNGRSITRKILLGVQQRKR